ncbi:deoxyribose-phosphate aldolase [Mycolicibacterium sp. S3B2]|uniref:deoxyribose-phosphate aldolase n=1 Tax=Mycolicibacterium sp. S3B2 TaxID=3415120 RepID=UPI003C7E3402
MGYTRSQVAALIDHTLLKPEATEADVVALLTEAADLGVYAVCVSPPMVSAAAQVPGGPVVAAVAGFPSGKHLPGIKAEEAAHAVADGAREVDMVIDVGAACSGELDVVRAEVAAVRSSVPQAVLKVIVESAVLLERGGEPMLADICRVCEDAGADFVKSSTGFHSSGGASVRAVEVMAGVVGGRLGVKASGGIRTAQTAIEMLDAGATRLGLSASRAVLDGLG